MSAVVLEYRDLIRLVEKNKYKRVKRHIDNGGIIANYNALEWSLLHSVRSLKMCKLLVPLLQIEICSPSHLPPIVGVMDIGSTRKKIKIMKYMLENGAKPCWKHGDVYSMAMQSNDYKLINKLIPIVGLDFRTKLSNGYDIPASVFLAISIETESKYCKSILDQIWDDLLQYVNVEFMVPFEFQWCSSFRNSILEIAIKKNRRQLFDRLIKVSRVTENTILVAFDEKKYIQAVLNVPSLRIWQVGKAIREYLCYDIVARNIVMICNRFYCPRYLNEVGGNELWHKMFNAVNSKTISFYEFGIFLGIYTIPDNYYVNTSLRKLNRIRYYISKGIQTRYWYHVRNVAVICRDKNIPKEIGSKIYGYLETEKYKETVDEQVLYSLISL